MGHQDRQGDVRRQEQQESRYQREADLAWLQVHNNLAGPLPKSLQIRLILNDVPIKALIWDHNFRLHVKLSMPRFRSLGRQGNVQIPQAKDLRLAVLIRTVSVG